MNATSIAKFKSRLSKLKASDIVTLDFETHKIQPRPVYPPKPVSMGLKINGAATQFFAWGHPTGNNCTRAQAKTLLCDLFKSEAQILCHGVKFDVDVACAHFELAVPTWDRLHDTMFLAFLADPNSEVLSLKPLADQHLNMPPQEETKLREWIVTNVADARRAKTQWGAYIAMAPGTMVEPYCKGDCDRTWLLFQKWMPSIIQEGMSSAYDRERRCVPMILDMEPRGIPVATSALQAAIKTAERDLLRIEKWLCNRLKLQTDQLDKPAYLADALEDAEVVEEWIVTKIGRRSVAMPNLKEVLLDDLILGALEYRSAIKKQLGTFALPWSEPVEGHGCIFPSWNQVRQSSERAAGRVIGARTGRLSSTPNVQNIPAVVRAVTCSRVLYRQLEKNGQRPILVPLKGLSLMDLRECVQAPRGQRLLVFDYKQQELRILAHYEQGPLLAAYNADIDLDLHAMAREKINNQLCKNFSRAQVKTVGFGILYAMGLNLLAESLGTTVDEASALRRAYKAVMPGVKALEDDCKRRGAMGETIRTWGGRLYAVEPPAFVDGSMRTFEYKMLNRLIQGSAADALKEAMLRYYEDPKRKGHLVFSVHDEIIAMAKTKDARSEFNRLKRHMESLEFDLAMPVDGSIGITWRECK